MAKDIEALNQLRAKPKPTTPEITEASVARYIREGAGFCPACESIEGFRRLSASTEFLVDDKGIPKVKVFASCTGCGFDWWEIYSLVGVEPT